MNIISMNLYAIMGVHREFKPEELKANFRILSSDNHPDKFPGDAGKAAAIREINQAYAVLRDSKTRKLYDAGLKLSFPACGTCKGTGVIKKQKGMIKFSGGCLNCLGSGYLISK